MNIGEMEARLVGIRGSCEWMDTVKGERILDEYAEFLLMINDRVKTIEVRLEEMSN